MVCESLSKNLDSEVMPDETWGDEELSEYARKVLLMADEIGETARIEVRRSAVYVFRAGRALSLARERVKKGKFKGWLIKAGIKRATAYQAIKLYEQVENQKALEDLSVMSAKTQFGVLKAKPKEGKQRTAGQKLKGVLTTLASCVAEMDEWTREMNEEQIGELGDLFLETESLLKSLHDKMDVALSRVFNTV